MAKTKIAVAYDEERFSVYGEGKLLLSVPSCVVRKKSAYPIAESVGGKAYYQENKVPDGYLFVRPFSGSKIADLQGAKLFIRSCFKKLFAKASSYRFYVLIETGLTKEDRSKIEKAFVACGYKNVYLVEKPYLLAKIGQKKEVSFVVDMGAKQTEAVTCKDGKIVRAYTMGIGYADAAKELSEKLCTENDMTFSSEKGQEEVGTFGIHEGKTAPILSCCSLFPTDYTRVTGIGSDIISGERKSIYMSSKELFSLVSKPYRKTTELIANMLMAYSEQELCAVINHGVFYLGKGVTINGFDEFMYDGTKLFVNKTRNPIYALKELYALLEDKDFLFDCLGVKE